jgi:NADH:ubiquinone oxidoreductase subunit
MRNETFSVYNEGVTWVVGLSAAAAGGAFLHYDALSSAPPYVRALFFVVVGCFLGTVGVGVQYAFWLHYARNEQDREQQLREREKSQTETADALEYYRELQAIANNIKEAREHVTSYHKYMHWLFGSGLVGAAILFGLALIPSSPWQK